MACTVTLKLVYVDHRWFHSIPPNLYRWPTYGHQVVLWKLNHVLSLCGPGSSVGIATDYGLDGPGIESRWGEIFRPVQTGPGVHPASCMGTGSFPGGKYGRVVLLTTHPLLVPWSWQSRAIPLPTLWATTGPVTGTLYLYYHLHKRTLQSAETGSLTGKQGHNSVYEQKL